MTLRHMRIFTAVCDSGSVTQAAEQLAVSQPAVSLAVSELEAYYGVALFDRISRRLRVTEAGRQFYEYATGICGLFDDLERTMRSWESAGIIRLGASISIGTCLVPEIVGGFSAEYPETTVRVRVDTADALEELLRRNELDFALSEGLPTSRELISEDFMGDTLTVAAPAGERCRDGGVMALDEFLKAPLLLREKGSGTRAVIDQALAAVGATVQPVWESVSTAALLEACIRGLGLAVVPRRLALPRQHTGELWLLTVAGLDLSRTYKLLRHRDKRLTPRMRLLMERFRAAGAADMG